MSVCDRVCTFLKSQPGIKFCVKCIAHALQIVNETAVYEAVRILTLRVRAITSGIVRVAGICSACGRTRRVAFSAVAN